MKRNIIFSVFIAAIFVLSSCGKYEEGPSFSLSSKTSRVAGEWVIEKWLENGTEVNLSTFSGTFTFEKDGTGKATYTQGSFSMSSDLEWKFSDDKTKFIVRTKGTNDWGEWEESEILRLTNKEFWYKETTTTGNEVNVDEVHLKSN